MNNQSLQKKISGTMSAIRAEFVQGMHCAGAPERGEYLDTAQLLVEEFDCVTESESKRAARIRAENAAIQRSIVGQQEALAEVDCPVQIRTQLATQDRQQARQNDNPIKRHHSCHLLL